MSAITGRDYKKRSQGAASARWRAFGAGLLVGIALTVVTFGVARRHRAAMAAVAHRQELHAAPADTAAANAAANASGAEPTAAGGDAASVAPEHYDFYRMLPHFEVVVPEKEHPVRSVPSGAGTPVERRGVYVLQAGSYRRHSEAERVVRKLSREGITAKVQRVAVDTDVWYRVRIGPVSRLSDLAPLRRRLQAQHLDALVIRIGD